MKKRGVQAGIGAACLLVVVPFVLWQHCGFNGCPDVDRLKGYVPAEASVILDYQGLEIGKLFVERRVVVALGDLPAYVPNAFVAVEDRRFWKHHGVDWLRVLGAAWKNARQLRIEQGASTITMQLARNIFPEQLPANERTVWRKIREARVAAAIEDEFTKQEILELYLNQIYFGNGAYGIETAAQEYFGKQAAHLTLAEAATLAMVPRRPARFNPRTNREQSMAGRNAVLVRMANQGLITPLQATQAVNEIVLVQPALPKSQRAPYAVETVRRVLEDQVGRGIYTAGYTIHTTLDLAMQTVVEEELLRQVDAIESGAFGHYRHTTYASAKRGTAVNPNGTPYLQVAAVFMDARTGDLRALVGGRDYQDSQFNRATQARRQAGSAFKPFVYAAAIAAGYPPSHQLLDQPYRLVRADQSWAPRNYDRSYTGALTMRESLTWSRNVSTIRLGMEVGIDRVVDMAVRIGLEGRIPRVPSVVLGAAEVTPLALTSAYSTFATLGRNARPRLITRVEDRNGVVIWSRDPVTSPALDPAVAYILTSILKDVVDRGTGSAVRSAGFSGVAAGKTGTTNDATDVWFVGYTPRLVGTIWMGFDRPQSVLPSATGGLLAAPVWGRIMRRVGERTGDWSMPAGVETRLADAYGNVYDDDCATGVDMHDEYFMAGMAPTAACSVRELPANQDCYNDLLPRLSHCRVALIRRRTVARIPPH